MSTSRKIEQSVFDASVLAAVQRLIPPERLHGYLRNLDLEYRLLVTSLPTDSSLQSLAHKIVSQAGMLGLNRMCACAQTLENACRSGAGQEDALQQCRAAAGDVQLYAMPGTDFPQLSAGTRLFGARVLS